MYRLVAVSLFLLGVELPVNQAQALPPPGERPRDPVTRRPVFPKKVRDRSRYGKLSKTQINRRLRRVARKHSLRERMLSHSHGLLGAHYRDDPLGEGEGGLWDQDPRLQLAPVDCLTFVETVMALSLAPNLKEASRWMDRIRYAGDRVAYEHRNHFMLSQWLPNQHRLGLLKDITAAVAGASLTTVVQDYDVLDWKSVPPSKLPLHFQLSMAPAGRHELPTLPWYALKARARSIPTGTLLLLVRAPRKYNPVRISHVGIVIQPTQPGGVTVIRHASREGWGRVVDQKLTSYVEALATRSRWPAVGVNLQLPMQVKQPEGRLAGPLH